MKIIDLFGGVGGLSYGFELAGFETICSIDNWSDAIDTYNYNRVHKNGLLLDIEHFNNFELIKVIQKHEISGVIGGPPCQGFSTARLSDTSLKIHSINEKRNHLYLEFFKTVKTANPDFFLIENVKGMVTKDQGIFVKDILNRFGNLGYHINYEVVNAVEYGVPQNRLRVIFIGMKNAKFRFPEKKLKQISSLEALCDLPEKLPCKNMDYVSNPQNAYQELMRKDSIGIFNHEVTEHSNKTIEIISKIPDGGSIRSLPPEYWHVRKFHKAFQRMNSKLPSHTIDTGHRNYFHYKENRIPTVRESARIQSFPDNFIFLGSKTSQYKQVGNAVPPLLSKAIAEAIMDQIK